MATAFVNKHMTRVLAAGATDYSAAWIAAVDAALTANSLHPNLMFWSNPAFGVIRSGTSISKIFDLGCTRLPRGGDYTPESPANTTYSATGLNSTTPAAVNASASLSMGYYGSARGGTQRWNNIRRKHHQGLTLIAAFQSGDTNPKTFLALGDGGAGFSLQSDVVAGQAKMSVSGIDAAWAISSSVNQTGATAKIIAGTFDGLNAVAYAEGTAGTASANATQDNIPLLGLANIVKQNVFLCSGARRSFMTGTTRGYSDNQAAFTFSDLVLFDTALSAGQIASLTSTLRTRIGA